MSDSSFTGQTVQSGPSMSMIDNSRGSIGIGNYKGVMLCNRPFGGTAGAVRQGGATESNAFTCGVISDAIGVNVTISSKDKHRIERPKKDSVISKHRKWLLDLQKQKDSLESQYVSEMAQKKESHDKFSEQESKLRKLAKSLYLDDSDQKTSVDTFSIFNAADSKSSGAKLGSDIKGALYNQSKTSSFSVGRSGTGTGGGIRTGTGTGNNSSSNRPAWALTETAAETAVEEKELNDEDDLLSFAEGLDFDRYIGDMEVRTVMDRLRQRIAEMEKEVAIEELREGASELRADKKKQLADMIEEAMSMAAGESKGDRGEGDKDSAAARYVLQSTQGAEMGLVHSNRSVTAMIKSSRDKQLGDTFQNQGSTVLNHPTVVIHLDDDGARLAKHSAVSNLPYMHRNPAV